MNLATAYGNLGNHVEMRNLLERVLKIRTQIYGSEHFETSLALSSLGDT